jgi:hypothetical protein
MKRLDVRGRSRLEIAELLKNVRRDRIYDLVHELVTIEEHWSPEELARARKVPKSSIDKAIRAGRMPGVHRPSPNVTRISQSGVEAWDRATQITPVPAIAGNGDGS